MPGKNVVQKILANAAGRATVETGESLTVTSNCPVTLLGDTVGRGPGQVIALGIDRVFDRARSRSWPVTSAPAGRSPSASRGGGSAAGRTGSECRGRTSWTSASRASSTSWPASGSGRGPARSTSPSPMATPPRSARWAPSRSRSRTSRGRTVVKGSSWVEVPAVARITLTGTARYGVLARDVYEYVLGRIGETGTPGQVILWDGDYVAGLSMDGRFTLCANALFSSAWTAIIEPDERTLEYARARTTEPIAPLRGDPDAEYVRHRVFDVSGIEPQVVRPPRRATARPVRELEGTAITKGHIGSCVNGRLEDMRIAARILKGRHVHPDVVLNVTPGSVAVYRQALDEGLIHTFVDAGVREVKTGDDVEIDLARGTLANLRSGAVLRFGPYPSFLLEMLGAGGLYGGASKASSTSTGRSARSTR